MKWKEMKNVFALLQFRLFWRSWFAAKLSSSIFFVISRKIITHIMAFHLTFVHKYVENVSVLVSCTIDTLLYTYWRVVNKYLALCCYLDKRKYTNINSQPRMFFFSFKITWQQSKHYNRILFRNSLWLFFLVYCSVLFYMFLTLKFCWCFRLIVFNLKI